MADFNLYYPKLKVYEGGYASAAFAASINDSGGETYRGIARNYNPTWAGWDIIDEYKKAHGLPKYNSSIPDARLDALAKTHSKTDYWDKLRLDSVKNQSVAEAIGDFGFNSGLKTAAKAAQRVLGLKDDGVIGTETVEAINKANQEKLFNDIQNYRKKFIGNITSLSEQVKGSLVNRVNKITYTTLEVLAHNPGKTLLGIMAFGLILGSILYFSNNN